MNTKFALKKRSLGVIFAIGMLIVAILSAVASSLSLHAIVYENTNDYHFLSLRTTAGGYLIMGEEGYKRYGAYIELMAEPYEGYVFVRWESSAGGRFYFSDSWRINVFYMPNNATTVTAVFVRPVFQYWTLPSRWNDNVLYNRVLRCGARREVDGFSASLTIDVWGRYAEQVSVSRVGDNDTFLNRNIPGFIGRAVEVSVGGDFEHAALTFEMDPRLFYDIYFVPAIYIWDGESQFLFELADYIYYHGLDIPIEAVQIDRQNIFWPTELDYTVLRVFFRNQPTRRFVILDSTEMNYVRSLFQWPEHEIRRIERTPIFTLEERSPISFLVLAQIALPFLILLMICSFIIYKKATKNRW